MKISGCIILLIPRFSAAFAKPQMRKTPLQRAHGNRYPLSLPLSPFTQNGRFSPFLASNLGLQGGMTSSAANSTTPLRRDALATNPTPIGAWNCVGQSPLGPRSVGIRQQSAASRMPRGSDPTRCLPRFGAHRFSRSVYILAASTHAAQLRSRPRERLGMFSFTR